MPETESFGKNCCCCCCCCVPAEEGVRRSPPVEEEEEEEDDDDDSVIVRSSSDEKQNWPATLLDMLRRARAKSNRDVDWKEGDNMKTNQRANDSKTNTSVKADSGWAPAIFPACFLCLSAPAGSEERKVEGERSRRQDLI